MFFNLHLGDFIQVHKKSLTGLMGKNIDNFLAGKQKRMCRFWPVTELGKRLANRTYTGELLKMNDGQNELVLFDNYQIIIFNF